MWVESVRKESVGRWHEAHRSITSRREIKDIKLDVIKQEKPGAISSIKQIEHRGIKIEDRVKEQEIARLVSLVAQTNSVKEKGIVTNLDAKEKGTHPRD